MVDKSNNDSHRFSQHIIDESKLLIESKRDIYCPDYSKFIVLKESHYSSLLPYAAKQVGDVIESHFGADYNISDILDATAHVGCDTIYFQNRFGANCISLEIQPDAYTCLVKNQNTFNDGRVSSTQFSVQCNCLKFIRGFKKKMDFVYFDPPWGGPEYKVEKKMMLYLEYRNKKIPIYTVIQNVFKEGFTQTVILKTPRNFNIGMFRRLLGKRIKCSSYKIVKPVAGTGIIYTAFFINICTLKHK